MSDLNKVLQTEEKVAKSTSGMAILILAIALEIAATAGIVLSAIWMDDGIGGGVAILFILCLLVAGLIGPLMFAGLKVLGPNEALVLTLFGKYYGTLKGAGYFFVNPFTVGNNPGRTTNLNATASGGENAAKGAADISNVNSWAQYAQLKNKKLSLKAMTLSSDKQKINDQLGNPIIIGIVVIWRVSNTAKAVFNVDNYKEFLSIQCDSALRNIVRMYPYDASEENNEKSLRGSSDEISQKLKEAIQEKVDISGLEIVEARITHLSYAQEIAAAMLQRQQASAIIDARQMIVDGAVGMVEMAIAKLSESQLINLDEERKAAMVSNLLVVLCGNKDAQPIVNSGSIY